GARAKGTAPSHPKHASKIPPTRKHRVMTSPPPNEAAGLFLAVILLRNRQFFRGDEFQQRGHAFFRLLDSPPDRWHDFRRLRHAFAVTSERTRHRGVVSG